MFEIATILEKIEEERGVISLKGNNLKLDFPEIFNNNKLLEEIKSSKFELIEYLKSKNSIPLNKEGKEFITTSGQKRLWLLSQTEEGSRAYHITRAFETADVIDLKVLKSSISYLINRHEILRTSFYEQSGELYQKIHSSSEVVIDLDFIEVKIEDIKRDDLISDFNSRDFDLETGSLLRFLVLKEGSNTTLAISMHHIITDGWSFGVFINELISIYTSEMKNEAINLPSLKIQFKDYALWNENKTNKSKESKTFWQEQLKGELPILDFPTNKTRPAVKTFKGCAIDIKIDRQTVNNWKNYFIKEDSTLYVGLLSGFYALLSRYTSQDEFVIGTVNTGRNHIQLQDQIGFYVNTLPLRIKIPNDSSFQDIIRATRKLFLETLAHQTYSFDKILDCVDTGYTFNRSRNPLFDCMLVLQNNEKISSTDNLLEFKPVNFHSDANSFDFNLVFSEELEGGLTLSLEYNSDIFDSWFIKQLGNHFIQLMNALIKSPLKLVSTLDYLTKKEEDKLIKELNDTIVEYPKDKTIVDLFEEQVKRTPNNIAVVFEEVELTYKELDEKSNQLANYLLNNYSIEIEDLIGVKLEKNEWVIVSILAILKSGAAYVPIDPNYPEKRISYIEKDTNCRVIIDEALLIEYRIQESLPKELPQIKLTPNKLAYVIYTSGSTGNPKGVMIEHGNIIRLVKPCSYFPFDSKTKFLSTGSVSFDATTFEFFGTLLNGSRLILLSKEKKLDIKQFKYSIIENNVNSIWMTSSAFNKMIDLDETIFSSITHLIVGGDIVSPSHVKKLQLINNKIFIINGYGPTENTTFSTTFNIELINKIATIPIGKPIDNTQCYIMSEKNKIQPLGVVGELFFSGEGLSRGYLNNKKLTNEKFKTLHYHKEELRLYKTGDLAKWLPDGNIEFLGRNDNQVKIRGYRIELDEIENCILKFKGVNEALVISLKENKDYSIIVSYIKGEKIINKRELSSFIKKYLPDYMVPSHFIQLEEFPLTPNGKIDKKALPNPTEGDLLKRDYEAPKTEIEKDLHEIWREVLEIEKISIIDNFFNIGGHSLRAVQITNRVNDKLNLSLTIKNIFKNPTIKDLSSLIESLRINENDLTGKEKNKSGISKIRI